MGRLELEDGLKARQKITQAQQKKIKKLYLDAAKRLEKEIETMNRGTKSESLQKSELEKLVKKLKAEAEKIGLASEEIIKQGMQDTVDATLEDAKAFLADLGLPIQGAYSNVANEIIESIVTGKIYKGRWSLSASIWDDIKKTQSDILKVVAEGRAMNKSSYEIAKDLERYVNPNAKKDWDWSKVYPGTKKKVDYNAQRLARTLSNHAYQQGVIASAKNNPFVKGIKWNTSNNHDRVCEVCEERAKQDKYGLGKGVYPEDKVPMDHPNGVCILTRVMLSSAERAERLADWVNGKADPEMDKWYKGVYGKEPPENKTGAASKSTSESKHKTVSGKDLSKTWKRRESEYPFEVEDIINAQGFDGMPQLVGAKEFEAAAKKSKFAAQRIYSAPSKEILESYRESLYTGKWYVDCSDGGSQFGKGMYCASDTTGKVTSGMKQEMNKYKDINESRGNKHSFIETFTLSEDARIIKYQDVIKEKIKLVERLEAENASEEIQDLYDGLDEGSVAALLGYDAILVEGRGSSGSYTVILNRTKLIIKRDD